MESLFLSFIVPVYNAERYLPECLDSLLNQGIPHSEYEIICVNDGSKDGSLEVLRSYQSRYPNITVIDKENGGVAAARNDGLAAARGEYIWFVDSDDFLKEHVLARLLPMAKDGCCDRVVIGCYIFYDVLTEEEKALSEKKQLPLNGPWYDSIVVRSLFRRSFLEQHRMSFRYPDITHGEDGLFMYEYVIHNPSSVIVDEAIYFYRIHSGSAETAVSLVNQKKKFHSYTRIAQIVSGYYQDGQKNAFTANKIMQFLWFALHSAAVMPVKESFSAMAQLKALGLFPFRRLPECDLTESYMAGHSGLIGWVYDKLCMHLHTRLGYALMFLLQQLRRLKRRLLK